MRTTELGGKCRCHETLCQDGFPRRNGFGTLYRTRFNHGALNPKRSPRAGTRHAHGTFEDLAKRDMLGLANETHLGLLTPTAPLKWSSMGAHDSPT